MSTWPRFGVIPLGEEIATFEKYEEVQRAVDVLADAQFPVQKVSIIGTDLRMVERVTGRMTFGRAAFSGALSGMWFGLMIGLLWLLLGAQDFLTEPPRYGERITPAPPSGPVADENAG